MSNMNYTYSITSKGQITIPKEFRDKLGLDKIGKATVYLNDKNEIVIIPPKSLIEVRAILNKPTFKDNLSDKEKLIGNQLAKKYGVR
jgi:AbrB family looped-hinge helix DNA binding protein